MDQVTLTHSDARNVAIVVNQAPLMADQVQPQDMVVDFVGVLVETAESVDLVVSAVGDGCIDETGRTLSQSPCDFGTVPITAVLEGRIWHDVGVVGRGSRGWCES